MMRTLSICILWVFSYVTTMAQVDTSYVSIIDSIEKSLKYQTGIIKIPEGNAEIKVPVGFRFLDKVQSSYVLSSLWGNPEDLTILGMLVPENTGVLDSNAWVFTISYEDMGYVKDEDANDINYDDLLKEQQEALIEGNPDRIKNNYEPITLIGWASAPYYDKNRKVLHWAKELKFGETNTHTLNYNLRILGRKGIFLMNAVADMHSLPEVKNNVDHILSSVSFDDGSKYSDFDPKIDQVAAYTIGGLVAGKVLAKAGIFVMLAKFWKFILIGFAALGSFFMKFFRKGDDDADKNISDAAPTEEQDKAID